MRALAGDVKEILDRNPQAGERRGDITGRPQAVLCISDGAGSVAVDFDEAARLAGSAIRASDASTSARLVVGPAARSCARLNTVGFAFAVVGMASSYRVVEWPRPWYCGALQTGVSAIDGLSPRTQIR